MIERAAIKGILIKVECAEVQRGARLSIYPIDGMIADELQEYLPQVIAALTKQIDEAIAVAWQQLEAARKSDAAGSLKVIK
jgi:hypothetical protein